MSMCRVFSCVVGRGCLLWPVLWPVVSFKTSVLLIVFCLSDLSTVVSGVWTPLLLLYYCHFLLLCLLVFALYIEVFCYWVPLYLWVSYPLLYWSLYIIIPVFVFSYCFSFKVCFIWHEYHFPDFLGISDNSNFRYFITWLKRLNTHMNLLLSYCLVSIYFIVLIFSVLVFCLLLWFADFL